MDAPEIPQKFPCWVKAVYSWGGESKRDLGFIEGDLIECLNAGDGAWWTGRLRRDKRMVGMFPSNFVKVLSEDFQPIPRPLATTTPNKSVSSQLAKGSPHGSATNTPPPKIKTVFRLPFTAYASGGGSDAGSTPNQAHSKSPNATPSPTGSMSRSSMRMPYASMRKMHNVSPSPSPKPTRPPSPTIPAPIARGTSPRVPSDERKSRSRTSSAVGYNAEHSAASHSARVTSPLASEAYSGMQRPLSPTASLCANTPIQRYDDEYADDPPPIPYHSYSRTHFPAPESDLEDASPMPPPPPAHRVPYVRHDPPYQLNHFQDQHAVREDQFDHTERMSRSHSPVPSERYIDYPTPPQMKSAMNDVMNSLEGMSLSRSGSPAEARAYSNPWSPDAFDEIYSASVKEARQRTAAPSSCSNGALMRAPHAQTSQTDQESVAYRSGTISENYAQLNHNDYIDDYSMPQSQQRLHHDHLQHDMAPIFHDHSIEAQHPTIIEPEYTMGPTTNSGFNFKRSLSRSTTDSSHKALKSHRSAHELGRQKLQRTLTAGSSVTTASSAAQSSSTNSSSNTQMTSQSLMSGYSAGGFSATSAGSLARRKWGRSGSVKSISRPASAMEVIRPGTSVSTHSSHSGQAHIGCQPIEPEPSLESVGNPLKKKKSGFLRKMLDTARTSAATARSTMSSPGPVPRPPSTQSVIPRGVTSISGGTARSATAADMGLGDGAEWVQMRRDVNRSNSLSRNERNDRAERCQMLGVPVISPVDALNEAEGDEDEYGEPVREYSDFSACNHALVDKNARFINNLPALVNPVSLAQGYLCRPYRGNVQRLRAIFTWVSERITWEEDFAGDIDTRRVLQTRRGCSEEIALLVAEMCAAVGVQAEIVRGYLKPPGEPLHRNFSDMTTLTNHWWNAVLIDREWRIMDCALAGPSHPRRNSYSSAGNQTADSWWFLARPTEVCYTHVPLLPEQQHIVPPVAHGVLMALPVASPACFKYKLRMWNFDTSLLQLEGLEMAHIHLIVPDDVDCVAEVEARAFARDDDGDYFESGDTVRTRALAQGEYVTCGGTMFKRYTIRAVLPSSSDSMSLSNSATLKIYAGHRGLLRSVNSIPHPLALSLPLSHQGDNPDYEFFTRHPTPHALRHELYVTGPLCRKLVYNSTFVFGVRQHLASAGGTPPVLNHRPSSPSPSMFPSRPTSALGRANSALSIASISVSGSAYSNPSETASDTSHSQLQQQDKPAKLAIQSPSGKIMKMSRKVEPKGRLEAQDDGTVRVGSLWETIVKIGERGVWRGLVLADRSARWCVFAEWESV